MSERISAMEASRRYHISDKTLRKWIDKGKLKAEVIHIEGLRQFSIDVDDLEETLAARTTKRETSEHTGTSLATRLVELQEQVDALENRVAELEQQITGMFLQSATVPLVEKKANRPPVKRTTTPASPQPRRDILQPADTIPMRLMEEVLKIDHATLFKRVKDDPDYMGHVSIPNPSRPGENRHFFKISAIPQFLLDMLGDTPVISAPADDSTAE